MMDRRQVLLGMTAVSASIAGCSATDGESPAETETSPGTQSPPTEDQLDPSELANEPNYDQTLIVQNQGTETYAVAVQITHDDTAEVIYEDSVAVDPGTEIEVFDFSGLKSEYDSVQTFEITAETTHYSDGETFVTSQCHGLPEITVYDDELSVTYAIC